MTSALILWSDALFHNFEINLAVKKFFHGTFMIRQHYNNAKTPTLNQFSHFNDIHWVVSISTQNFRNGYEWLLQINKLIDFIMPLNRNSKIYIILPRLLSHFRYEGIEQEIELKYEEIEFWNLFDGDDDDLELLESGNDVLNAKGKFQLNQFIEENVLIRNFSQVLLIENPRNFPYYNFQFIMQENGWDCILTVIDQFEKYWTFQSKIPYKSKKEAEKQISFDFIKEWKNFQNLILY